MNLRLLSWGFVLFLGIAGLLPLSTPASASPPQPTFVGQGAIAAAVSGDLTPALPTGYLANDLFLLECFMRTGSAETVTVSGWTAVTGSPYNRGTVRYWLWYDVATSASETAPLFDTDGATGEDYCDIAAYRGADIASPFGIIGTAQTGTASPATITGVTTPGAQNLIVLPLGIEEDGGCPITVTSTDPVNYIEHTVTTTTGADACLSFSEEARITAGATGNIGVTFTGSPVGWGTIPISIKPPAPTNGHNSLVSATTSAEGSGANCANGGTKVVIKWGVDDGDGGGTADNGVLDAGEVDGSVTFYSCKGDKGDTGSTGATGPAGKNALVKLTVISPIDVNCPLTSNGETLVQSGVDTNGNGLLDPGEVQYQAWVCGGLTGVTGPTGPKGDPGTNGTNGKNSLVRVESESPGGNCADGGLNVTWGLDANSNGVLSWSERSGIAFVCNGAPGATGPQGPPGNNGTNGTNGSNGTNALVNITLEPPGANCTAGGLRIDHGQDLNGNGILDAGEAVPPPQFACNGLNGAPGAPGAQGPPGSGGGLSNGFLTIIALVLLVLTFLTVTGKGKGPAYVMGLADVLFGFFIIPLVGGGTGLFWGLFLAVVGILSILYMMARRR